MRTNTSTARNLTLAASFVAILAASTPISARPAREVSTPRDVDSPAVRVVKQIVKKIFGISINETITIPIPKN
jgi:hypothetical protein